MSRADERFDMAKVLRGVIGDAHLHSDRLKISLSSRSVANRGMTTPLNDRQKTAVGGSIPTSGARSKSGTPWPPLGLAPASLAALE
jgi:hypothetical protein